MTGDQPIELNRKGVELLGRPSPKLPRALKQVNRVHVTHARGLQERDPISIKHPPLGGSAKVSGHHANRRGIVCATFI
jgi:hypothetical protein